MLLQCNCIAKMIGSLKKGVNLILLIHTEIMTLSNSQRVKEFTEVIFSVHIILAYSKNKQSSSSQVESKLSMRRSQLQGSSWKVIPKSFSHSFHSIPGSGGGAGLLVLLQSRSKVSYQSPLLRNKNPVQHKIQEVLFFKRSSNFR